MKLTLIDNKPALTQDDGTPVYFDIYIGTRYRGKTRNVLKDYTDKCWRIHECQPFTEEKKDFSLIRNAGFYTAKTDNAELYAVVGETEALFRTCIINGDDEKSADEIISLGGLWQDRFERVLFNSDRKVNGVRVFDMSSGSSVRILTTDEGVESAVYFTALDCSGQAVQFGHVSFENYFSAASIREDGRVETHIYNEGRKIAPHERICSDWIRLSIGDTAQSVLLDYTRFVRDFGMFQKRFDRAPVGFSTWYYYLSNIDERTVFENMAVCEKIRDRVPLEVFQIDAGWGSPHSDDLISEKFPKGMKYYADYIKDHGMRPGIWLSPFDFGRNEPFVVEHPECFVHNIDGELLQIGAMAVLDATHPTSQAFLRDMFRKVTYEWGYRYLKIDIVTNYLTGGVYYEKGAGPLQNLRAYFKCAREYSHPDTYILACTAPMLEIAEFVDGMRIAGDIFERWESVPHIFQRILLRFYLNNSLFWSDPDCLLIRKKENEDDDCRRNCSRTDMEIRTFETAVYAAGGALFLSDKLPLMSEAQIADYAKFFPHVDTAAIPLDLMDSHIPSVLDHGYTGDTRTVAFFNWGERPRSLTIPLDGPHSASEHWDGTELGTFSDAYTVTLQPHGSQLVYLTRVK